jgi:hypothetical protein
LTVAFRDASNAAAVEQYPDPKILQFLDHPAFLAWRLLHGGLKNRFMNQIPGEASFRAVFAPVEPHAVVT